MSDLLRVDDLQIVCVIGVYAEERHEGQTLRISLALALDAARAARSGHLHDTVDYARLCAQMRFVLQHAHFRLIESAAEALCAVLLRTAPLVETITLTLLKPEALGGNGLPSLTITRRRKDAAPDENDVAVVWPGPDASIHVAVVRPGMQARLPATATVFDIDEGREGSLVSHEGRVAVAPGERARTLLVVTRRPLDDDAVVVQRA